MTTSEWEGVGVILAIVAMLGIYFWAFSSKRKDDFDEASKLPFADDVEFKEGQKDE